MLMIFYLVVSSQYSWHFWNFASNEKEMDRMIDIQQPTR